MSGAFKDLVLDASLTFDRGAGKPTFLAEGVRPMSRKL